MTPLSRPTPHFFVATLALCTAVLDGGCGPINWFGATSPSFSDTAKGNYDKAIIELGKKNWLDAIKLFQYTKSKFSFSKYATLAELGIAEADFGRDSYATAIDGYRNFIKAHPSHEKVVDGYAAWRIGQAFHKEIPTEWFLVPPAYEKDQGPVRDALRELSAFLADYPDSPYALKAKTLEEDCVKRLADHELYVAEFYLKKKHPLAAANRLDNLAKGTFLPKLPVEAGGGPGGRLAEIAHEYMRTHLEARVLLQLAKTQLAMDKLDEAEKTAEQLIATHASEPQARKAQGVLDEIQKKRAAQLAAAAAGKK